MADNGANGSAAPVPDSIERARKLLAHKLRVFLKDGRVLEGDLQCVDKLGNFVLSNACELVGLAGTAKENQGGENGVTECPLGMVLVPHAYRTGVKAQLTLEERTSMLLSVS